MEKRSLSILLALFGITGYTLRIPPLLLSVNKALLAALKLYTVMQQSFNKPINIETCIAGFLKNINN